jgi:serine/threonine protein kinase
MTSASGNMLLQNRYQIVRLIGKGGMGAVYEAFDHNGKRPVALKLLLNKEPQFAAMFAEEAQALANLKHKALPKVLDHFEANNQHYLVMEFVPGQDLADQLLYRGQPFPIETIVNWGKELLDVLEYLHSRTPPVIHRDIKPQNLKIGEHGTLMLLDFGLAKPLQASGTTGKFAQISRYAALEQLQAGTVDARSDLYALGATLYHLATGQKPIDSVKRSAACLSNQPDPLPASITLNSQIPHHLDAIMSQALALSPEERPTSAAIRQVLMTPLPAVSSPTSAIKRTALSTTKVNKPIQNGAAQTGEPKQATPAQPKTAKSEAAQKDEPKQATPAQPKTAESEAAQTDEPKQATPAQTKPAKSEAAKQVTPAQPKPAKSDTAQSKLAQSSAAQQVKPAQVNSVQVTSAEEALPSDVVYFFIILSVLGIVIGILLAMAF